MIISCCVHNSISFATPKAKRGNTTSNYKKKKTSTSRRTQQNTGTRAKQGYLQRSSGIRTKRKKPPKWEREGDELFFIHGDNTDDLRESSSQSTLDDGFTNPRDLLNAKFSSSTYSIKDSTNKITSNKKEIQDEESDTKISKFLWGKIPAGPILSPKLNQLFDSPTPIQTQVFKILSKSSSHGPNVVIASPTGSGKTLAFLLPLIANTKRDEFGKILIVTPTIDLANQIQRVVNQLWEVPKVSSNLMTDDVSRLYVVKSPETRSEASDGQSEWQKWTMSEMKMCKVPIMAGTPKSLLQLLSYCRDTKDYGVFSGLNTIVLDEADRLLKTEVVARGDRAKDCPTIQLLELIQRMNVSFLPTSSSGSGGGNYNQARSRVRLVCASATVGRTLRRQIMDVTNAISINKAAELIVADDRTSKDDMTRRNSLLPSSIQHVYSLYEEDKTMVDELMIAMKAFPPAPTLIFPGKMGVIQMVEYLRSEGMRNVNTLRDNKHWKEDDANHQFETPDVSTIKNWNNTPIYVVGEKFSRGLDIPNISYVFIASPPSSSAAYTHLSGRTGRAGNGGLVITMIQGIKEARRLITLSTNLGVHFSSLSPLTAHTYKEGDNDYEILSNLDEQESGSFSQQNTKDSFTQHDLNQVNVPQLKQMLRERNLKVSGRKQELIDRLLQK